MVHCRAELNTIPQGWKALGQDAWGFEMYIEAGDQQDEGWQQRQRENKLQRQREKEELLQGALPPAERDEAIRRLHKHFGISSKHRQKLRDRGLSDEHIDSLPYFSIYPNQPVPPFTPANLPGVSRGKLTIKREGFTCPIPDVDGRIIGWQNRFDEGEPKYTWASGDTSSHLPSGELPIGVYRPDGAVLRRAIGMAEGFLKPDIIAQMWGLPTLGAASANFASSPEQSKASLDRLSGELWTRTVYWFADAGAVSNPHVNSQYQRSWELLTEWGYQVQVVWYGQIEKSALDADEISPELRESARLISIDEYCAIAREHGGIRELPQTQNRAIDRDEWELKFGFGKRLRNRVKQTLEGFKGFGKTPTQPIPQPKEAPDKSYQDSNQRLKIWQDAVLQGYKYILDRSAPALGKSHGVGIALPDAFGVDKLWYVANDHRNPTTGIIEANYTDLPVRHKGLKQDVSRLTPNGNPFLRHPQEGEEPDTPGNCYRADLFRVFAEKGYNVENSSTSPLCSTCKVAHLCSQGVGGQYDATFRGDRNQVLAEDRIRAHCDSLPNPGAEGFDYSSSGLFWDEIGTQLKPVASITISLADFDRTFAELECEAPELHEELKPVRLALRPLLTGEVKQPRHGWDDGAIRALLPQLPEDLDCLIQILEEILEPDLSFLENQAEFITAEKAKEIGISQGQRKVANREFRRQAHQEFSEGFQNLALNWLVPFLKVLNGERGAIRCEWRQFILYTHNPRPSSVANAARFNIFLDATISRERLALLLGIDPSEIYVVEQETPAHGNLRIIQVTGMGKLGKTRSETLQQRVAALRAALEQQHPGIRFGDWKAQSSDGDGRWFVNLRGSNEFQSAGAMAVFGVPYQNIGYLQTLYQTLTDEFAALDEETPHEGLQRFIDAHVEAEIEQAVGRLRSHIRPDEQLTFYFVGDYDLSFLGVPVEQIEAFQITPEAGTPAQVTRWKILEAVRQLQEQGKKITQQAIAATAKISQPLISKIAREFGSWQGLRKILLALLNNPNSGSNNFAEWDAGVLFLAKEYLPSVLDEGDAEYAVEEIAFIIQNYGMAVFLRVLHAASPHTHAKLLALFLRVFRDEADELIGGLIT